MLDALRIEINIIAACILILLLHNRRRTAKDMLDEKLYQALLYASLLYAVCDSVAWVLDGISDVRVPLYVVNCLCYLFCVIVPFLWLLYAEFRLFEDERSLKRMNRIFVIPVLIYSAFVITTPFTGLMFTINNAQEYERGPLLWLHLVLSLFYIIFPTVRALKRLKGTTVKAEQKECFSIGGFIVFPLIGVAVQALFYGMSAGIIATVLAELMVYINIQNKQISLDALTLVNNRGQFNRYLNVQAKKEFNQTNLYMLLLDIDYFKHINDTYGHKAGDQALIDMANLLQKICDENGGFIARYGGDEFAIVLEKANDAEIKQFILDLQNEVKDFNDNENREYKLSVSIGYSCFGTEFTQTVDELVEDADAKMYQIKEQRHSFASSLS